MPSPPVPWPSFARRLALWSGLVVGAGLPSISWALLLGYCPLGILAGLAAYIVLFTIWTGTAAFQRLWRNPCARRAIYIVLGLRLGTAAAFPIGMATDFIPGVLAVAVSQSAWGSSDTSFAVTLLATAIQGAFLNLLLLLCGLIVFVLLRTFWKPAPLVGVCLRCGYDLRATPDRCPECGTPVPPGHRPAVGALDPPPEQPSPTAEPSGRP